MKKNKSTYLLILILLLGLSLLLYPTVSEYWNSFHSSRAIAGYSEQVSSLDQNSYDQLWQDAHNFNRAIPQRTNTFLLSDEDKQLYQQTLNLSGNGIMGYVEIPDINSTLPIYHGTDEAVLQIAVGHLEWSSLPVGGEGTHCVLSGHRGLPSAKLFSDLDKVAEGDTFILRVLDEVLTYEVDQILIVEPNMTDDIQIVEGQDYCTLVTCTPYGINSHRLLVRGHRIENAPEARIVRVTADASQIEPLLVAPVIGIPLVLILMIPLMLPRKHRYR